MTGTLRGQKRESEPLELELQTGVVLWEPNLGSLKEWLVFLTTEQSLQTSGNCFLSQNEKYFHFSISFWPKPWRVGKAVGTAGLVPELAIPKAEDYDCGTAEQRKWDLSHSIRRIGESFMIPKA